MKSDFFTSTVNWHLWYHGLADKGQAIFKYPKFGWFLSSNSVVYFTYTKTGRYKCRQTLLFQIQMGLLISDFGYSTWGETQFLKVFHNHTMLTPPPTFSISCGVKDLNSSLPVEIRKTQLFDSIAESPITRLHGPISTSQLTVFQNPQILRTISSRHDIIHTPAPFPIWGFIMTIVIVISFVRERKTVPNDYAPEILTRIVQSPTKLNDKI